MEVWLKEVLIFWVDSKDILRGEYKIDKNYFDCSFGIFLLILDWLLLGEI